MSFILPVLAYVAIGLIALNFFMGMIAYLLLEAEFYFQDSKVKFISKMGDYFSPAATVFSNAGIYLSFLYLAFSLSMIFLSFFL